MAAAIEEYLSERPGAEDTQEGIAALWLRAGHRDTPALRAALNRLVTRGRVALVASRGRRVYRRRTR